MARHPGTGAVERRAALLVNVLARRELPQRGCSAVTFRPSGGYVELQL
jgi:hypothetical protein